jgi:hypothetical protein
MADQQDMPTAIINGKKMVAIAGRWQPAEEVIRPGGSAAEQVQATRRPAVEANAQQGLDAVFRKKGQNPLSIDEQILDELDRATKPKLETDRPGYMEYLKTRIAALRMKGKDVKASGSGNIPAQHVYEQAAEMLNKQLMRLQDEDAGSNGAASQPTAGGQ